MFNYLPGNTTAYSFNWSQCSFPRFSTAFQLSQHSDASSDRVAPGRAADTWHTLDLVTLASPCPAGRFWSPHASRCRDCAGRMVPRLGSPAGKLFRSRVFVGDQVKMKSLGQATHQCVLNKGELGAISTHTHAHMRAHTCIHTCIHACTHGGALVKTETGGVLLQLREANSCCHGGRLGRPGRPFPTSGFVL